ncbi:MAG: cation-transporting P-type ATPase, partial [Opitutaceae bacterium]|nr:cation-transporting P-type ATPase [Opitutaceae bacterium]
MRASWTDTLAEFLRREPGVGAVRVNIAGRTVDVATLGAADEGRLRAHVEETLRSVAPGAATGGGAPRGFVVRNEGGTVELAGESCPTAPAFWRWRRFDWPAETAADAGGREPCGERGHAHGHSHEAEDWRALGASAALCGLAGLAGFLLEKTGAGPWWLAHLLTAVALVAGGWDAALDSWRNLRERRLDIHFLMLAVGAGA